MKISDLLNPEAERRRSSSSHHLRPKRSSRHQQASSTSVHNSNSGAVFPEKANMSKNDVSTTADNQVNTDSSTQPKPGRAKKVNAGVQTRPVSSDASTTTSDPPSTKKKGKYTPTRETVSFKKADPVKTVNYPPFQPNSQELQNQLTRYCIYPEDDLSKYPIGVPFKNDKFLEKTGLGGFDGKQDADRSPVVKADSK